MELDNFVKNDDVPFEYGLVKDGDNAVSWSRYLSTKRSNGDEVNLDWLYERCLNELSADWPMWREFLNWRRMLLNGCDFAEYEPEYKKVTKLFEKCLQGCDHVAEAWIMYLEWVIQFKNLGEIRNVLEKALRRVQWESHEHIWQRLVEFIADDLLVNKVNYRLTLEDTIYCKIQGELPNTSDFCPWSSSILERYSMICDEKETVMILISKTYDWRTIARVYKRLLVPTLQPSQISLYELYMNYLTALILTGDTVAFNTVVDKCLELFPFKTGAIKTYNFLYSLYNGNIETTEELIKDVVSTTKDISEFTVVYDFWIRMEEVLARELINNSKASSKRTEEKQNEIESHIKTLQNLIEEHQITLNDLQLRKEPSNISLWLDRVKLFSNVADKVKVYTNAMLTIDTKLQSIPGQLGKLWCDYAKLFEEDTSKFQTILDKATNVPYKFIIDLEDVWLYWAECRLKSGLSNAIEVLEHALTVPDNYELLLKKFEDGNAPAQAAMFSSKRLWSMYLDLLETQGHYNKVKSKYELVISIKTATPGMFVNYALFEEALGHSMEALSIFERAVEIFPPETSRFIWEVYIAAALRSGISKEHMRDIFEAAIKLSEKRISCVSFFDRFSSFELNSGFPERSVEILHKGAKMSTNITDQCVLWEKCISRSEELMESGVTRRMFEDCIQSLPNSKTTKFLLAFVKFEEKQKEFTRCRALYKFGSKLLKPTENEDLWESWRNFETLYGTKEAFKDMLRTRRFLEDTMKVDTEEVSKTGGHIEFVASSSKHPLNAESQQEHTANVDEIELDL